MTCVLPGKVRFDCAGPMFCQILRPWVVTVAPGCSLLRRVTGTAASSACCGDWEFLACDGVWDVLASEQVSHFWTLWMRLNIGDHTGEFDHGLEDTLVDEKIP